MQVICAVLQIINQIIKDNTDFQENACLVGLVSTTVIQVFMFSCWTIIKIFEKLSWDSSKNEVALNNC